MQRREALAILGGAAVTWPLAARAQQKAMPVIGILNSAWPNPGWNPTSSPLPQGLSESGYVAGQNMSFERRWAEGQYDRLPALAAELVHRNVDLIVTFGGTAPALAAKSATATIPIVFTGATDPVAAGLVTSLARPGGNVTGFSVITSELAPKRLDLIAELVPQAGVIAMLVNPNNPTTELLIRDVQEAAREKGIQLSILKASTISEIDAAFASLAQLRPGALIVDADSVFTNHSRREQLATLAARYAVPAIGVYREFAASGGLISYGPNITAIERSVGVYAGRILKGAKPADLPVQRPTKFELVVNLKTASALGLRVPQSILARADEVIE